MLCSAGLLQGKWCSRGEGSFIHNLKKVENIFIEKLGGKEKLFSIDGRRVPQGKVEKVIGEGSEVLRKGTGLLRMRIPENIKESWD